MVDYSLQLKSYHLNKIYASLNKTAKIIKINMKIGIYDPYLDTLSGGERYMLTAASCLSSDNEVTIFWNDEEILEKAHKKLGLDLKKIQLKPNIFSPKVPYFKKLFMTLNYDIIFILSDGSIPVTLAKKTIIHFQFPVEWVNAKNFSTKLKLSLVSKVICNSNFTKKFIDRKFNLKSEILYPPCINSTQSLSNLFKKQNIILTVGRYSPSGKGSIKKTEMLINAFQKMIDRGLKNWEFIIVISFSPKDEKKLGEFMYKINNYPIKILSNLSHDELSYIYYKAKLYWHAAGFGEDLEKNPHKAEHFGITTVEAMSQKVVPLVFEAGGQTEIVDNKVNGYSWQSEDELINLTKKIILDEHLRSEMSELAQKKSLNFTKEKFCTNLRKILY